MNLDATITHHIKGENKQFTKYELASMYVNSLAMLHEKKSSKIFTIAFNYENKRFEVSDVPYSDNSISFNKNTAAPAINDVTQFVVTKELL